ncbi:hypothetical protein KIH74_28870 [Kineosporia sp. J2-2]|uniref:Uncharacterized protein n=1 Tax=Kineosporia corallincola TaxID=2835133 RepID=A0ABS5TQZ2_9ACTN|nr:hypothetical protein [Kineosporia corallincola]MBT0772991.1 hypothetical protein [Kineosporia corallincola]
MSEHSRPAADPRRPASSLLLQRIVNLKLGWLLTGLVLLSVATYSGSYWLERRPGDSYDFLAGLARLVADASLSTAVIGIAYEWLIRQESNRTLELMFQRNLDEHDDSLANTVVREIPRALILDRSIQRTLFLRQEKLDEILRGALLARLGDEEMSGSIYDGLLQKTFSYEERFVGLRIDVTLSNVRETEPQSVRDEYYDVVVSLRYRTKLNVSKFIFARVLDPDQYNVRTRDPNYIFTWRVEESAALPRDSPKALDLYRFSIDDRELEKTSKVTGDGAYEIHCEDEGLAAKQGQEVAVHYSVATKLSRRDHVFFYTAVRPTKGITLTFNYARTDIANVLTYDFFVSGEKPVIETLPREDPHTVMVELDEWVFPKGGVAFVWKLQEEDVPAAVPENGSPPHLSAPAPDPATAAEET